MIKECTKCPLYQNMPFGPCETANRGDIYCLFAPVNEHAGIADEIVTGMEKVVLRKLVPESRWFLSSVLRCYSEKISKKHVKICSEWITEEINQYKITKKIVFGMAAYNSIAKGTGRLYEINFSEKIGEFLFIPPLYRISLSAKYMDKIKQIIGEYVGI